MEDKILKAVHVRRKHHRSIRCKMIVDILPHIIYTLYIPTAKFKKLFQTNLELIRP